MKLPQTVGPYRLVERLGSGSFGTVYRAEVLGALGFSQDVAVKVLDPARAIERPDMVASLADEAALMSRLQHPFIVQVRGLEKLEHDFLGTTYAMVMELVRGIDLRRLIDAANKEGQVIPVQACMLLLSEIAEALQYAHELTGSDGAPMNFVHRDMKPGNVLVNKDGRAKILDFGIAFAAERKVTDTAAGMTKGTVLYMSPEQVRGQQLTGKSDIYSVGLILFEMLTGEMFVPLPEGGLADIAGILVAVSEVGWYDRIDVLRGKLRAPEPGGQGLGEEQAEWLEGLLAGMLQPDPDERIDAARLVELTDEIYAPWRLKRGRTILRDFVGDQYATFDKMPSFANQALAAGRELDEDVITSGHRSLEPPAASAGRRPGGPPVPVVATRIMEATGSGGTPAAGGELGEEPESVVPAPRGAGESAAQAAGASAAETSARPVAKERAVPIAVFAAGLALLLIGGLFATMGEDPADMSDGLPPLAPVEPDAPELAGDLIREGDPVAWVDDDDSAADDDDSADRRVDDDDSADGLVEDAEDVTPRTKVASAPRPRRPRKPKAVAKPEEPEPTPEPTPAEVATGEQAWVAVVHDPPKFVVPGAPLVLSVLLEVKKEGELCTPRVILAPRNRRKYRRYPMKSAGGERYTVTVDVPYDDQWAKGVRYFVECCWDEDCPERWRGPGAPWYLDTPEF